MSERILDDGFGNVWEKCDHDDCVLEIVRPGKVQCERCQYSDECALAIEKERGDNNVEIRLNRNGTLDEVCGNRATAHLEQLDSNHWFLSIGNVNVWLHAKGKITATYEYNRKDRA